MVGFFKKKYKQASLNKEIDLLNIFYCLDNQTKYNQYDEYTYYYNNCQPLSDAISWISNNLESISIKNFAKLQHNWINTYLLYGDLFLLKLNNAYSIVDNNMVTRDLTTHKYEIRINDSILYFDKYGNGISNNFFLVHLKNLNTFNNLFGNSFIAPIVNEIKIIINGNMYNANVLQNGARLDGILSFKGTLTQENENKMKSSWQSFFNGIKNVGKTLFLNTHDGDIAYTPMAKTNKDMEFNELIKNATISIYKNFKIPLPLISADRQTYSNYAEAQAQLYDNAIEPILDSIILQLQEILNDKQIQLDILSLPISAKIKNYNIAKIQNDTGVLTINEIRKTLGLEALVGGDILRDNKVTPIAYNGSYDDIVLYDVSSSKNEK